MESAAPRDALPPTKTRKTYITVAFSRDLYDRIARYIETDPHHGYVSVSEFLKDAARRRLDELDVQRRAGALSSRLDEIKPDVDRAAAKVRAAAPRSKFCHTCGAALIGAGAFCSSCGTKNG